MRQRWTTRKDARPGARTDRLRVPVGGAIVLGALFLVASGCLFSTRTPDPPLDNGQNVKWEDPSTPLNVLNNVRVTFAAKSIGNYTRSLSEDFTFLPDLGDEAFVNGLEPNYFQGWTKQREIDAFTSVFQLTPGTATFAWGPSIPEMLTDTEGGGGRYYPKLQYKMKFAKAGADTTISGLVNLYLREAPEGWIIYKWADEQDGSGNATLGLVRWRKKVEY